MKNTILAVQRSDDQFTLLKHHLAALGYTSVIRCHSVAGSLEHEPLNVNCIFTDIISDKGDNPLRELRQHFIGIPIIAIISNNDTNTHVSAIRNGAQEVLVSGRFNADILNHTMALAHERKVVVSKLRYILEDYRRHFENGPIPMWIVEETSMKFLVVNNAAVKKYGYTKEEFSNLTLLDIRPEEDVPRLLDHFSQRGTLYNDAGYWRHKKKNGEVFYVHAYSHNTQFQHVDARLCFLVDVNEKILADQRNKKLLSLLTGQKEILEDILVSINDAIWSRKAGTHELIYGNRAYYQLYDTTPEELAANPDMPFDAVYPADREIFAAAVHQINTEGTTELSYRYVHKSGAVRTLSVRAILKKGVDGKPDTINGITFDITKEKELYDAIRNSEQKLRATINNTNDLIWSVNRNLEIIYCNKAYQDFFYKLAGIALDEGDYVLGPWHSQEFIQKRKRDYERAFNGESFSVVVEEEHEGEKMYFEINSNPIVGIDEKIVGVNCVSRNITEQVNQLNKINNQNERLREIAWIQSHKVRGPVATILGLISLAEEEKDPDEREDLIQKLKIATGELDTIIKDIVHKTSEVA